MCSPKHLPYSLSLLGNAKQSSNNTTAQSQPISLIFVDLDFFYEHLDLIRLFWPESNPESFEYKGLPTDLTGYFT